MANTSVLQMAADLTASTAAGAVSQLMPSGTVLPFAGVNVPAGWLPCDGSEVSQTTYASLFAAVQTTYNTQVNPTTGSAYATPSAGNFRLPDYRGLFLRGVGTSSGGDSTTLGGHQSHKTAPNGLSVSGAKNQMNGSMSGNTGYVSHNHTHQIPMGDKDDMNFTHGTGQNATADGPGTYWTGSYTDGISQNHYHGWSGSWDFGGATFSTTTTGDNETRPVNRGINYIIKV